MTIKRNAIITGCLAAWIGSSMADGANTESPDRKPNVVVILADDLGWADVGFHGSKIKTPNIDRLCAEGVELTQHYVQPMCTPTRVGLLTGRYPSRFGDQAIKPCNERVLPFGTETLASALGSVGYHTGLAGKWHLGSQPEWGPSHFGFRHSYGSLAGGCGQFSHLYKKGPYSRTWHRNETLVDEEGHTTDLIAREVVGWIEQKKTPWFYYVPFTAVHVPVEVPGKYLQMYEEGAYDSDPARDLSFRRYAAYTTHMDDAIGRILEAVRRTGQRENTLVIFTSDNGSFPSWRNGAYPGTFPPCPRLGSNLPYRGYKAQLYEGGIHSPTCVCWPGKLEPGKVDAIIHVVDWMPTLTRLAGYQPKSDLKWDGIDIWPWITGKETQTEPRTIYWKFTGGRMAIRHGDWKLIVPSNELFNLADDPYEKRNLAKSEPARVADLLERLARAQKLDVARRLADP
jgi:arylsulfatase A-like enzyme